jgi:hypothetical protein
LAVIKLVEDYSINYARTQVRDALMYHGEEAVLLQLFHPEIDRHVGKCPRCSWDAYNDGENLCPVCYGTNLYDDKTQTGGVKDARRAWCVFSDHVVSEQLGQRGVMAPDTREVQCEPFPMLMEHDVIARVKNWDPITHIALSEPEFYSVDAVTRNSLRTGNRFGQTWEDVIGQKAQCSWFPPRSSGIQLYPIQGVSFPAAQIQGTPVPTATVEPDTKVVFYPVSNTSGVVTGATPGNFDQSFTFTQEAPSTTWTITHTLGHLPQVTIIVGGEEVDADVDYPSITQVVINFAAPQSGTAELV